MHAILKVIKHNIPLFFISFIKHSVNLYIQGNNLWDIEFVIEKNKK